MTRLIDQRRADLGSQEPLIATTTTTTGHLVDWLRHLSVGGEQVAHIGNNCDTCGMFFELAQAEVGAEAVTALRNALAEGLDSIDEAIAGPFGTLLPRGAYVIALIEGLPIRVEPGQVGDYFCGEQWLHEPYAEHNEPLHTNTHYYRLDGRSGFATGPAWYGYDGVGFEFVVPLPQAVDPATSAAHAARMNEGARPTAVSFAQLDVKQRHDRDAHWCMVHYLLDGHHKLDAAARLGQPVRLLAFIPVRGGFCTEDQLATFLATYDGAADLPEISVAPAGG